MSFVSHLFGTFLISVTAGCSLFSDIGETDIPVAFSASLATSQIIEGQQTSVKVGLVKNYGKAKAFTWKIIKADGSDIMASSFTQNSGSILLKDKEFVEFTISSKPGSISTESEKYSIIMTCENYSFILPLTVINRESLSSVSISNTENGGFINLANHASYHVSGTCSIDGSTVTLNGHISDMDVTSSTSCHNHVWATTLDFSGAPDDGSVPLSVLMDNGSESIASASSQVEKDTLNPTLSVSSPTAMSPINNSTQSSFNLNGTCSENFRFVSIQFSSSNGGTPTTASALCFEILGVKSWTATANISSLNDGTITADFSHSDLAGNISATQRAFIKDTIVPALTINSPTALTLFNETNFQSMSVTGTCTKNGSNVLLSGDVSGSLSTTCGSGLFSFSGLTLSGADGVKHIQATTSDTFGNQTQYSLNLQKDTLAPTAFFIGAPSASSNASSLSVAVNGVDVSFYSYKIGPSGSTDCFSAVNYSADVLVSDLILDPLGADGSYRLCVRGIDANGNKQSLASATAVTWAKDTVLPTVSFTSPAVGSFVNRLSQSALTVTGTCSEPGTQNVHLSGHYTGHVNCLGSNNWTAFVDFSSAADGPVFLVVSQTDAAGNFNSQARTFTKETIDPTISITTPLTGSYIANGNKAAFTVSGACSEYSATDNVTVTSAASVAPVEAACNGTTWSATLEFRDGDEVVIVSAQIADTAGNTATASRSFNKDTTDPAVTFTQPVTGTYINSGNQSSFPISGTCSEVGTSNIAISGAASANTDCLAGNTWSTSLDLSSALQGALNITVTHMDAAGNQHQVQRSFDKDTVAPQLEWSSPISMACASNSTASALSVSGICENGSGNVTINSVYLPSALTVACSSSSWATTLNLDITPLADLSSFALIASQTDSAGNTAQQTLNLKKLVSAPTVTLGGWEDIYAVGVKVYADTHASEPGIVRIGWNTWPTGTNTCQPDHVKVYRATSSGGVFSLVSNTSYPAGIPAAQRTFTDLTLVGSTAGTVAAPTDFSKGWYYRLKVSIAGNDYDVSDPTSIAEVRVAAPPTNMALVHRWMANQEICGLMNRATDSTNHYRCSYSGWGRSAGNFYDMMTDLIVDRYEVGCNVTFNCGASGNQACVATEFSSLSNPASGTGVTAPLNAVFYDNASQAHCYVKTGAGDTGWTLEASMTTTTQRQAMVTNKAHVPPLAFLGQTPAYQACQTQSITMTQLPLETFPKEKRLLRQKEWRAAAAWPRAHSSAHIKSLESGGVVGYCNTNNAHGDILDNRRNSVYPLPLFVFETGSNIATIQCQSRYGIQDMVGNMWEMNSDQLTSCTALGDGCVGVTSTLDSGNTDMNGFKWDGATDGPKNALQWTLQDQTYSTTHLSIPLGLPLVNDNGGNAQSVASLTSPIDMLHNDRFSINTGSGTPNRCLMNGGSWNDAASSEYGRWSSYWNNSSTSATGTGRIGFRCVTPLAY